MRPSEVLAAIVLLSSACDAAQPGWDAIAALKDVAPILRRQDDQSTPFDLSFTGRQGNTATTEESASETSTSDGEATTTRDSGNDPTSTGDSNSAETNSGNTRSGTARGSGTARSTGTGTKGESTKTYDARLPAGGVSMITPNAMSTSYYKIADYITFAWNYTSLSSTPSAVDVLASCTKNHETYTIASNVSVEETNTVVWDTGKFQSSATVLLLTETYTLIIHDAAKEASARPSPGYLGTYDQFTFGMYSPQPYTPMADYVCATCNSALSLVEKQTMWALLGMVGLTVLSFGWFTGVAGLW